MAIALSLLAAIVYGAADFCGGIASRRTATIAVVVWSQAAGFALLALVIPMLGGTAHATDLGWGAVCGVLGAAAVALLYRGLAIGTMGVVSPITAVLAAALPALFGVTRGERPSLLAFAGIAAALVAVVCVSAAPAGAREPAPASRRAALPPGVAEALAAGALFGLFFIALAQTRAAAGMYPLLAARVASVVILGGGSLVVRRASLRIARGAIPLVALAGALDMSANVLYVLAVHRGAIAIVAVLTSLYPAATVALAAVLLRERLGTVQWIGVALALAGVIAISARP